MSFPPLSLAMLADKRALDDLDALFRAVPAQTASASRLAKRPRTGRLHSLSGSKESTGESRIATTATAATESQQERIMYTRVPAALLPKGFRGAPSTPRGSGGSSSRQSNAHNNSNNRAATAVGAAAANRLTEFVRGVLGARGDRAAAAAMESRLERKVVHLVNVGSGQAEAQSAGARAGRAAGRATRQGLSGKQCKKMGLNTLKARGNGRVAFRDLLGLHGLWKDYASRLTSQCGQGSNPKLLQQRILAADLQGCYLTVSRSSVPSLVNIAGIVLRETPDTFQVVTPEDKTKTIPKHSCAVRLVLGGHVVDLNARALKGRRGRGGGGGQKGGRDRDRSSGSGSAGTGSAADDADALLLATAAL